jgi:GrpB-like predicted nucleotidyltransferase (UPF0157 family)
MSADVDEPIELTAYDSRWPGWYTDDAMEIRRAFGDRLRAVEHFGSTAVVGLAAKPVIDILVAPMEWPLARQDLRVLESLGYEHLGEAGVPGREYFRRRAGHATNLAVVRWDSALWQDNTAVRDYLRSHPKAAASYARAKQQAWADGARTLLRYSAAKSPYVNVLVADARIWNVGQHAGSVMNDREPT